MRDMLNGVKLLVAGVALALAATGAASATTIVNGSDDVFVVDQTVKIGGKTATLGGTIEFSDFQFTQHPNKNAAKRTTTVTFDVDLANLTPQGTLSHSDWQSVRLVSFGFDTNPDATKISDSALDWETKLETNFPGFQKVDVCGFVGPNCAGGGNGGLHPGQTDDFTILLTFGGLINSFDLGILPDEIVATKWQTAFGSFEVASNPPCLPGTAGCGFNPPVLAAPEPSSLILGATFLLGTLLLAGGDVRGTRRGTA